MHFGRKSSASCWAFCFVAVVAPDGESSLFCVIESSFFSFAVQRTDECISCLQSPRGTLTASADARKNSVTNPVATPKAVKLEVCKHKCVSKPPSGIVRRPLQLLLNLSIALQAGQAVAPPPPQRAWVRAAHASLVGLISRATSSNHFRARLADCI